MTALANPIQSSVEFGHATKVIKERDDYIAPAAFGLGVATMRHTSDGEKLLAVKFNNVNFQGNFGTAAVLTDMVGPLRTGFQALGADDIQKMLVDYFSPFREEEGHANVVALERMALAHEIGMLTETSFCDHYRIPVVVSIEDLDKPPATAGDAYLRLHLLSMRYVQPHGVNLDGIFGILNNNVWTNLGVFDAAVFDEVRDLVLMEYGSDVRVHLMDKFPHMLDYVTPSGVRVVDSNRVRLGAHLAEGTTVMPEGFVNFNAGTLGPCMIEGRLSAGVVVGARSDIGGGASIMGTLSGGNDVVVSIGEDCLLEAECGLGIPIGDRVRVAAGHYVKSTSLVRIDRGDRTWGSSETVAHASRYQDSRTAWVKAESLSGISDAVFRRNDRDGASEVVPRGNSIWGELNAELHTN